MVRYSIARLIILTGLLLVLLIAGCSSDSGADGQETPGEGVNTAPVEPAGAGDTGSPAATFTPEVPVETPTPEVTPTPRPRPPTRTPESSSPETGPSPTGITVNGVPLESFTIIPDETKRRVKEVFDFGQVIGRDPKAFSKLGDSLIASPNFLTLFDTGPYNLGVYDYLQPAIDYFAGSYERYGVALREGLHAWAVFDPMWAHKEWCEPNETLLACEIRYNNPSMVLILLGTNDSGNPGGFEYNMRQVVDYCFENGVIPVLVTKADRFEGPDNTNNEILRQVAADKHIPLIDFDVVAETIPNRGLRDDQVHLTVSPNADYTQPDALQTGHGVHNLVTLMMLEEIRRVVAP